MVPSAVADAKENMALNGVKNVQFYANKAEDVIRDVINSLSKECDITVVVDPPRAGLHTSVIQALRYCTRLRRVIFVSCNLEAATHNFVEFARPTSNRFRGSPFIPVFTKAVDLFPQTRHVEALILLERVPEASKQKEQKS
ncbi:unnamed protein product [Echinostoma caproni]|uniref:tRNA (uracil(54)-C(5))-methyltransferase n=1 Tax=Echinostoma caproni TaxID=27848 RepID=A0A183BCU0_9TREM|nr:unnamed protein product [Echinostoma caproni]